MSLRSQRYRRNLRFSQMRDFYAAEADFIASQAPRVALMLGLDPETGTDIAEAQCTCWAGWCEKHENDKATQYRKGSSEFGQSACAEAGAATPLGARSRDSSSTIGQITQEGSHMGDANETLPAKIPTQQELETRDGRFATVVAKYFTEITTRLNTMELSAFKAEFASEQLIAPAARYLEVAHAAFDAWVREPYDEWVRRRGIEAPFMLAGENATKLGKTIVAEWKLEATRREEQRRRELEEAQRKQAKEAREAEAQHAEAQGHPEAAAQIRQEPIVPVAVPKDPEATRVAGLADTKLVYRVDERNSFQHEPVIGKKEFLRWLMQNPDGRMHLVDLNIGNVNRMLANQDLREIPGLRIVATVPVRRKGRQ